jgi:hypothetical protein
MILNHVVAHAQLTGTLEVAVWAVEGGPVVVVVVVVVGQDHGGVPGLVVSGFAVRNLRHVFGGIDFCRILESILR